jgi:hypothetical protein
MNIFQLISSLSPTEIRDLRKWIRSDFVNQRADLSQLFEVLVKQNTAKKLPTKEKIWAQIFPEKPFNDSFLRSMGAWLTDLIEGFWVFEAAKRDKTTQKRLLARAYEAHGLIDHAVKIFAETRHALDAETLRHPIFWQQKFELESDAFRRKSGERATEIAGFQSLTEAFDYFFISEKLRQACVLAAQQTFQKTTIRIAFLEAIFLEIETRDLTKIPAIGVYFFAFKTLSESEDSGENLKNLRQILNESSHLFPSDELHTIYLTLLNFCISRMNQGKIAWQRIAFELYQTGIERGILFENGQISPFSYRNAAAIGLLLKEFDWTRDFLKKYKKDLDPAARESTHALALARLEYATGNFDAAMILLRDFPPSDLLGQLAAKSIILKIFYENKAFDALESHLEAMRLFIKRHREIGYHGAHYLNLISFVRQLTRLEKNDAEGRKKWKTEVENCSNLVEKVWILEKIGG